MHGQHYEAVRAEAQRIANDTGRTMGVSKLKEYGLTWVYSVKYVPAEKFRSGRELRCEIVYPETIRKELKP